MPVTSSPLRYPGGKTQLYSWVKHQISLNIPQTPIYIEPFSGGAGVALELLLNGDVERIVLNDLDPSIHSIWYSILNYSEEFIDLMKKSPITLEEWNVQKAHLDAHKDNPYSVIGGFAAFFLNRTNVSGIISGGPIGGKKQEGNYKINCRFNKDNLVKKIKAIAAHSESIDLYNLDAEEFLNLCIREYPAEQSFIFLDPPYYKQGPNLYLKFNDHGKHESLCRRVLNLPNYHWILTYDFVEEIGDMYKAVNNKYIIQLRYSANNKRKLKASEYLFVSERTEVSSFGKVDLLNF